jgi:ComF family protein
LPLEKKKRQQKIAKQIFFFFFRFFCRQMRLIYMDLKDSLSFFFFGSGCLACNNPKKVDAWLCAKCKDELVACGEHPIWPNREDAICLFQMNSLTRSLVLAMKYKGMQKIASYLVANSSVGRKGEALQILEGWGKNMLFMPVPVHNARKRERGYNQCEQAAFELSLYCNGKMQTNILRRRIYKPSQTLLGSSARSLNAAGAFEARRIASHSTAVIVDDVYTTGATTSSCARALKKAGFENIKICTLLYELPASAEADMAADKQLEWIMPSPPIVSQPQQSLQQ